MPRDYVKSRSPRRQERSGPSGIVWLLMGVFIGLIIAGIFYLKNQNRAKPAIPASPQKTAALTAAPPSQQAPKTSAQTTSTQNLQTQFDFYNVLPNQKVTGPNGDEDTTEIQNPPPSTSPTTPTSQTETLPTPSPQEAPIALPPPVPHKT